MKRFNLLVWYLMLAGIILLSGCSDADDVAEHQEEATFDIQAFCAETTTWSESGADFSQGNGGYVLDVLIEEEFDLVTLEVRNYEPGHVRFPTGTQKFKLSEFTGNQVVINYDNDLESCVLTITFNSDGSVSLMTTEINYKIEDAYNVPYMAYDEGKIVVLVSNPDVFDEIEQYSEEAYGDTDESQPEEEKTKTDTNNTNGVSAVKKTYTDTGNIFSVDLPDAWVGESVVCNVDEWIITFDYVHPQTGEQWPIYSIWFDVCYDYTIEEYLEYGSDLLAVGSLYTGEDCHFGGGGAQDWHPTDQNKIDELSKAIPDLVASIKYNSNALASFSFWQ